MELNVIIEPYLARPFQYICSQENISQDIQLFRHVDSLRTSFNKLILDPYLEAQESFRKRRFSTCSVNQGIICWNIESLAFYQSPDLNQYAGGIMRVYQALEELPRLFCEQIVIPKLLQRLSLNDAQVGVHQIRITANSDFVGQPAPEGPHQDGFDFICTLCIGKDNTAGGNSLILHDGKIIKNKLLAAGDMLLFDDRYFHHYVSPIVPLLPGDAYRDMFVFTINKEVK
jgi:hypothetical protein